MKITSQLSFILNKSQKNEILYLIILLFIGMIFEMGGIGILLPLISFFMDTDVFVKYSQYLPNYFHKVSHTTLIISGFSLIILFYFIKSAFLIYLSYRQSKFTANLSVDLTDQLFRGYLKMPYTFFLSRNTSDLIKNIQTEILHFGGISLAAMALCTEISAIFGISILLIIIEPYGSISVIIFFGAFAYLFNKITNTGIKKLGLNRQKIDQITNKQLIEGMSGAKEIKLLGVSDFFSSNFKLSNIEKSKIHSKIQVINTIPRLYLELLAVFGVSILVIVINLTKNDTNNLVPIIGLFVASAFRLIPSINKIINSIQTINFAKPVLNILYSELSIINRPEIYSQNNNTLSFNQNIKLHSLYFKYPSSDRIVLFDINLDIKKGDSVGFIGKTGSGKSTLINIIIGLLKPTDGKVLIDNVVMTLGVRNWQKKIGYVPQQIYLIDDTIEKNIAFGIDENEIDNDKISMAIHQAQLSKFIQNLTDGIKTIVGERGVKLSGGERQRIGIARALYHNPPILVLDEATSALDVKTEIDLMESVNSLHKIKTILIIAHRLSTIDKCDIVYELTEGKIKKIR